jgi:hypothetical protein
MDQTQASINELIKHYCDLDDDVREQAKRTKEVKQQMQAMQDQIITHMQTNSIEACNAGVHGILSVVEKTSKPGIKKEDIEEGIATVVASLDESQRKSPEHVASHSTEYIFNNRPTNIKYVLKRKRATKSK